MKTTAKLRKYTEVNPLTHGRNPAADRSHDRVVTLKSQGSAEQRKLAPVALGAAHAKLSEMKRVAKEAHPFQSHSQREAGAKEVRKTTAAVGVKRENVAKAMPARASAGMLTKRLKPTTPGAVMTGRKGGKYTMVNGKKKYVK